jgi:drug/metabolite transporter (DMT)-like permease
VVRHQVLVLAFGGSNPSTLAKFIMLKDSFSESFCYHYLMTQTQPNLESNETAKTLILYAMIVEVLNVAFAWISLEMQTDVCPKSIIPGVASIFLSIVALTLIILVPFFSKNKVLGIVVAVVGVLLVAFGGLILAYSAIGGMDWCAFLGR